MTRSVEELHGSVMQVLDHMLNGRPVEAVRLLMTSCPTVGDGFAACCGFANIIAATGVAASSPDAKGPVVVELEELTGGGPAPEAEQLGASDLAAFIAAVGNADGEGAYLVFRESAADEDRHAFFLLTLLRATTAVVRFNIDQAAGGTRP